MPSWRPEFKPEYLYFVTTTAVDHCHLFRRDSSLRLLLDTLDWYRLAGRIRLFGFVLMPNHMHFIGQFRAEDPLAAVLRDFKRHSTDRLVRALRSEHDQVTLDLLASKVRRTDKQHYKVWDDGYNAKGIVSEGFLLQKLEYIHNNPCQSHWGLSPTPVDYPWSSARFYLTDEPAIIPVDDVRVLLA